MRTPIRWQAEAIWESVSPLLPGFTVEVVPEIGSTNTELMNRARAGQLEPVLLVAEQQTAGRGRMGKAWQSRAGDSLTFSLGLPLAPSDWSGLSLAVGVAVAEALHPSVGLKWPNDLWVSGASGDRKLAGILVETAMFGGQRYCVVGIGINIAQRVLAAVTGAAQALPQGINIAPVALQELLPVADAPAALARIALPLVRALQAFEAAGFAPSAARFRQRDVLAGREVALTDGTLGTACGVADDGALLVHTANGMKHVTSAEVSVRPVSSAVST